MKNSALINKINRDIERTKKDIAMLGEDSMAEVARSYDHLTDNAKEMVNDAVKTINHGFGQGLSQYNEKVQDVADKFPGSFGKKATRYPWVTVTMVLIVGMLLGTFLNPRRLLAS